MPNLDKMMMTIEADMSAYNKVLELVMERQRWIMLALLQTVDDILESVREDKEFQKRFEWEVVLWDEIKCEEAGISYDRNGTQNLFVEVSGIHPDANEFRRWLSKELRVKGYDSVYVQPQV